MYLRKLTTAAVLLVMLASCGRDPSPDSEPSSDSAHTPRAADETEHAEKKPEITLESMVRHAVAESAETSLASPSSPSLEMRENADFILSPALLVQDWLDPNSVVTYPQE